MYDIVCVFDIRHSGISKQVDKEKTETYEFLETWAAKLGKVGKLPKNTHAVSRLLYKKSSNNYKQT